MGYRGRLVHSLVPFLSAIGTSSSFEKFSGIGFKPGTSGLGIEVDS